MNITMKTVLFAGMSLIGAQARAGSVTENIYWWSGSYGDAAGQLAGTCTYTLPNETPLSVPRTIAVDKNAPDGTVLFSWGYGEFWSDMIINCVSSGISNSVAGGTYIPIIRYRAPSTADANGFSTSDPGIRLKLWVRFNTECTFDTKGYNIIYANSSSGQCPATGTDIALGDGHATYQLLRSVGSDGRQSIPTATASISFRAELIKHGTVAVTSLSPLTVNAANAYFLAGADSKNYIYIYNQPEGTGIQLVVPACQLKTTNYSIPMGTWAADSIKHLGNPAYGALVPVNLALECRGEVAHVRFRFEDTGSSLSANKNVSLYDSAGGNKIDGLEIEMRYNGSKVDVDNSTLTDTGSHGSFTSISAGFDAVSTAVFHARYVQNSAVTLAGANYTGPVTGKVNMYVTYD